MESSSKNEIIWHWGNFRVWYSWNALWMCPSCEESWAKGWLPTTDLPFPVSIDAQYWSTLVMSLELPWWGVPKKTIPDVASKILWWLSEARSNAFLTMSPPRLCATKINLRLSYSVYYQLSFDSVDVDTHTHTHTPFGRTHAVLPKFPIGLLRLMWCLATHWTLSSEPDTRM